MGRFVVLVFAAIAAAAQVAVAQQGQNPKAALAPLSVLGDVPELRQRIIFNSLQSKLSEVYQLIPQELYEKAEEEAFQSLELAQCTEEQCIRRIQEILQVERLAVLQIIRDEDIHQLTLTIVRTDDKIVRAGICRGCGTGELESRVAGLVSAAVSADLGPMPAAARPPVETPKTGAVLLASKPSGADITLDGRALPQKTDTRLENLAPGRHTLEVTSGNLTALRSFDLRAGQELRLNLRLEPKMAALSVTSDPAGAEVYLDGERAGATPLSLEATLGRHEVTVSREGLEAFSLTIEVTVEGPNRVEAFLQPKKAELSVVSEPADALVTLDGAKVGKTPLSVETTLGNHAVTISKARTKTFTTTIDVTENGPNKIKVSLEKTRHSDDARETFGIFLGTGLGLGNAPMLAASFLSGGTNLVAGFYQSRSLMIGGDYASGKLSIRNPPSSWVTEVDLAYKRIGGFVRIFPDTNSFFLLLGFYEHTYSGSLITREGLTDNEYTLTVQTLNFGMGNQWVWDSGFVVNVDWGWYALVLSSSASNEDPGFEEGRERLEFFSNGAFMLTLGWAF